jgi:phosphoserine phosphatase
MNKIICFDVNGTLVEESSWEIFAQGDQSIERKINDIFDGYYSKKISIAEVWGGLVSILKKTGRANKGFVYSCWDQANTFKEGAEEVISYLKEKGYKIYLISCSIDVSLECMVKKLGLDGFYAGSHLVFDSLGELEQITSECGKGREFKKEKLKELAAKEGVSVEDIIFVGDGDNDIGVFEMTKHGIAMGDKNEKLLNCCWKQINNLIEIKNIL